MNKKRIEKGGTQSVGWGRIMNIKAEQKEEKGLGGGARREGMAPEQGDGLSAAPPPEILLGSKNEVIVFSLCHNMQMIQLNS